MSSNTQSPATSPLVARAVARLHRMLAEREAYEAGTGPRPAFYDRDTSELDAELEAAFAEL